MAKFDLDKSLDEFLGDSAVSDREEAIDRTGQRASAIKRDNSFSLDDSLDAFLSSQPLAEKPAAPKSTFDRILEAAKPELPVRGAINFVKDLGVGLYDLPDQMAGAVAAGIEGGDAAEIAKVDWKDAAINAAKQSAKSKAIAGPEGDQEYFLGITRNKMRNLSENLSFSLVSMGAGLSAAIPAFIGGSAVGTPVAGTVSGYGAGAIASGVAAYRMDTNGFLREVRDSLNAASEKVRGSPLTDEEFVSIAKNYNDLTHEHGLWEALPEAVGNVVGLGVGKLLFKEAALGLKGALKKTAASTLGFGTELGTETVTQIGQKNVEVDAGLSDEPKRSFLSAKDIIKSAEEVLPDVLLLTGVTQGGSYAAGKAYGAYNNENRQIAKALQDSIDRIKFSEDGTRQEAIDRLDPNRGSAIRSDMLRSQMGIEEDLPGKSGVGSGVAPGEPDDTAKAAEQTATTVPENVTNVTNEATPAADIALPAVDGQSDEQPTTVDANIPPQNTQAQKLSQSSDPLMADLENLLSGQQADTGATQTGAPSVTPDLQRQVNIGSTGSRFVVFESPLHSELFDYAARLNAAMKNGKLPDRLWADRLATGFGIPVESVNAFANEYRDQVIGNARKVEAGETTSAPIPGQASPLLQEAITQINGVLANRTADETIVAREVVNDDRLSKIARAIKGAFGVDLVFFDGGADGSLRTNKGRTVGRVHGYRIAGKNAVMVNVRSYKILDTIGHELTHVLETKFPSLYRKLLAVAKANVPQAQQDKLRADLDALASADAQSATTVDEAEFESELVAYTIGEQASDPRFWLDVFAGQENSVVSGFIDYLQKAMDALLKVLQGPKYAADRKAATAVRKAAVEAFQTWSKQEQANATQTGQVQQGGIEQRQGTDGRLQEVGQDRSQPSQEQAGGTEAGRGDSAEQGGSFKREVVGPTDLQFGFAKRNYLFAMESQPQEMIQWYLETYGRNVNPDSARELSPFYLQNPSFYAAAVHEGASKLAKRTYAYLLENSRPNDRVVMLAGGGGSGKGFAAKRLNLADDAGVPIGDVIIYDSVLGKFDQAQLRIEEALAAGLPVEVVYVNSPASVAFERALDRAQRSGRVVPLTVLADAHVGASNTIRRVAAEYGNIVDVRIANAADDVVIGALQDVPTYNYEDLVAQFSDILNERESNGYPRELAENFRRTSFARELDESAGEVGTRAQGVRGSFGRQADREGQGRAEKPAGKTAGSREYRLEIQRQERRRAEQGGLTPDETSALLKDAEKFNLPQAEVDRIIDEAINAKSQYPETDGWNPLFLSGISEEESFGEKIYSPKYQAVAYSYHRQPGLTRAPAKLDEAWAQKVADQFYKMVREIYVRADQGDKNAQIIIGHQTWYKNVAEVLRREYGAQGDLLADLLGATSPNTPVNTNWRFSIDSLRRFMRGEFNAELSKLNKYISDGGKISEFPASDKIRQASGKLYGMNSLNAMKAMLDMWRVIEPGSAPKARNFALNLIGQSNMATIDVWAARMLRRAANMISLGDYKRIPPPAETGVSGSWSADASRVTGEFGFGAYVMDLVSERLNAQDGISVAPPDLQAIAWFAEKELWGQNSWTTVTGEGGSFEEQIEATPVERFLAGWSIQQGEKVPNNDDVSRAQIRVTSMLVNDDSVVSARVMPTKGLYGGTVEESFDTEWTVRKGEHDPSMVMAEIAQVAKDYNQYDIFVSRVIGKDEKSPNARPGVEIYFKNKRALDEAMPVLERFTSRGQDGFTMAVDPRSQGGEYIGVRLQYIPEISMRWDEDLRQQLLAPGGIEQTLSEKENQLDEIVAEISSIEGVAYATVQQYDTIVVGKEDYDAFIGRVTENKDSKARGEVWFGQQIRQGLERAVARFRGERGQVDGRGVPDVGSAEVQQGQVTRAQFSRENVQKMSEGAADAPDGLILGRVPPVLRAVGVPDLPLIITREKVTKITNPERFGKNTSPRFVNDKYVAPRIPMTAAQLYALPDLIANPVAILRSSERSTTGGKGLVIMTTAKIDGYPVIVTIAEKSTITVVNGEKLSELRISEITTALPKNQTVPSASGAVSPLNRAIAQDALYFNVERAAQLAQGLRLSLPRLRTGSSNANVLKPQDIVNEYGENPFQFERTDAPIQQIRGTRRFLRERIEMDFRDVVKRAEELQSAANGLREGAVTKADYDNLVNKFKPVMPYESVPNPATEADMRRALSVDKKPRIGAPSKTLKEGDPVGLRLDIPAYSNFGVWVVSVHDQQAGFAAGKSIGYESVARAEQAEFGVVEKAALNIAAGKPKATIAVVKGNWIPVTPEEAKSLADEAINDPAWRQVGMDPERHSYFYDRETMQPVESADEVVQIGPLVLAKNVVYGDKQNYLFSRDGADGSFSRQSWDVDQSGKMDDFIYLLQDKQVDMKRVVQGIKEASGKLDERWDAYLQEELFHGRAAKRVKDFAMRELNPLLERMAKSGVNMQEFDEYLHARHAKEANAQVASVNPQMPDGGSGMTDKDADDYMRNLNPVRKAQLEALAKEVDKITKETREMMVQYGIEDRATIDAWESAYTNYVPLFREGIESGSLGIGQGYSVSGGTTKRRMGSTRKVVDVLANIAMQREKVISRGEKNRVSLALYGLAVQNPNEDFWIPINPDTVDTPVAQSSMRATLQSMGISPADASNISGAPMSRTIDSRTGLVSLSVNPLFKSQANVLVVRINGKDRALLFNMNNDRAKRMVATLKNLDLNQQSQAIAMMGTAGQYVEKAGNAVGAGTRYFASVNTQYNPVFGLINFIRDVFGGTINLSNTPIAAKRTEVLMNALPALGGIYKDLRLERKGMQPVSRWSALFEEFEAEGGKTGFRDLFARSDERAKALEAELAKINEGKFKAGGRALLNWLSDFNEAIENAVRLSAYKAAKDQGLSNQQAASLAKNLTVNFNRKGELGQKAAVLYAFFNASVQGTARIADTLTEPKGSKLSKVGKTIIAGGLALGVMQALLLAAADLDDDDPKEFIKDKNLIIPIGDGKYITIPMPLGYNVIPGFARRLTEFALSDEKNAIKSGIGIFDMIVDAFNPLGMTGISYQVVAPTVSDPIVAILENRDAFGRPIAREDVNTLDPTPGYTRAKENASAIGKGLAYAINLITGGSEHTPGKLSPTPDQIDYLIGQATGGVGREIIKIEKTVSSFFTGEELATQNIPIVGRFVGNSKQRASETAKFYDNVKMLNGHQREIEGREKDGQDASEYISANPESDLYKAGDKIYRKVSQIKKARREAKAAGASRDELREYDDAVLSLMTELNQAVREIKMR